MLAYVARTLLPVSDVEQALNFYVNLLDFEQRAETVLCNGGRRIEITPRRGRGALTLATMQDARPDQRKERFTGVILGTVDILATYQLLRARGVTFLEAPTRQPLGMMQAQFVDVDGNSLILVQP